MRRAFPWILSTILLVAFIASFSELQRMRMRFGEVTRHTFHDHAGIRLSVIKSAMAQTHRPIVLLGDSVAELAALPATVCGRSIVNAGIGGARLEELARLARELSGASLVIVVAGTNDAGSPTFEADYSRLIASIEPATIAVPSTAFQSVNNQIVAAAKKSGAKIAAIGFSEFDGVHPTPKAYQEWTKAISDKLLWEECSR